MIGSSTTVRSTCARSAVLISGAALVAVLLRVLLELLDHQLLQLLLVAEQRLQVLALGLQRLALLVQLDAVELGQLAEAQVEDVLAPGAR